MLQRHRVFRGTSRSNGWIEINDSRTPISHSMNYLVKSKWIYKIESIKWVRTRERDDENMTLRLTEIILSWIMIANDAICNPIDLIYSIEINGGDRQMASLTISSFSGRIESQKTYSYMECFPPRKWRTANINSVLRWIFAHVFATHDWTMNTNTHTNTPFTSKILQHTQAKAVDPLHTVLNCYFPYDSTLFTLSLCPTRCECVCVDKSTGLCDCVCVCVCVCFVSRLSSSFVSSSATLLIIKFGAVIFVT